jgi:hypothetical protein
MPATFDEYSVRVRELPPGVTPGQIVLNWQKGFNDAIKSGWFDFFNEFTRRRYSHDPQIGDIYDFLTFCFKSS